MKALKLILSVLVISAFASCASVTDANIDEPQADHVTAIDNEQATDSDSIWLNSNGDDMDPIIDKPDTGGTYHE
jgi:hypothetical protein